jgi:Cu-Zn family superoxide dismutase
MRNVRLVERFTWRPVGLVALFAMAMLASSCGQNQEQETRETPAPAEEQTESSSGSTAATPAGLGAKATATIEPRSGSSLRGTATFTEEAEGVRVVVEVAGAPPGDHAVHVHENGDCSAPDASSAGSHFNPEQHEHGGPHTAVRHPGDFGNLTVGADSTGRIELVTKDLTVGESPISVVGLSIIVHEKADDFSQPVGNAGGRIGCGLIEAAS